MAYSHLGAVASHFDGLYFWHFLFATMAVIFTHVSKLKYPVSPHNSFKQNKGGDSDLVHESLDATFN